MTKRDPRTPRRLPLRVEKRPAQDQWTDEELMTLDEAANLLWPDGPLTSNSLRTAVRNHELQIVKIAGKILTCKAALRRMSICRSPPAETDSAAPGGAAAGTVAEMQRRYLDRFKT